MSTEATTSTVEEIKDSYTSQEPIGVIGAPNTTREFVVQIRDGSIDSPLQGKLFVLNHDEGGIEKLILAQMTDLELDNVWHRKEVLKPVIKQRGALQDLSGDADTKQAVLNMVGVFEFDETDDLVTSTLNTPPAAGTDVYEITNNVMDAITNGQDGIFYAGRVYGSETKAPLQLRHFGPERNGGYGEGRRIGIFGKSGTGKSVVGAELTAGFAQHPDLGILILDPQGEFTEDRFGQGSEFDFSFHDLLQTARGGFETVNISDVVLETDESFIELLNRTGFFEELGYRSSNKRERLVNNLNHWMDANGIDPAAVTITELIDEVDDLADAIYSSDKDIRGNYDRYPGMYGERFDHVQELFVDDPNRTSIDDFLDQVLVRSQIVSLDLDPENLGSSYLDDDEVRNVILSGIMTRFRHRVYVNYREQEGAEALANALVVLDEAHDYVKKGTPDDQALARVKKEVVKSQKKSRKYGIGWMFINQRISDFDLDIYAQLESHIYCAGLGVGADESHIKDVVGTDMYQEYRGLPNPKQSEVYSRMISGSIVSLGTTGRPIIIEGFDGSDAVLDANS